MAMILDSSVSLLLRLIRSSKILIKAINLKEDNNLVIIKRRRYNLKSKILTNLAISINKHQNQILVIVVLETLMNLNPLK